MCPHRWQHSDRSQLVGTPRRGGGSGHRKHHHRRAQLQVWTCSHLGITVPWPDGQYLRTEPLGSLQGLKGVASRALSTNNPPYVGLKTRNYAGFTQGREKERSPAKLSGPEEWADGRDWSS